MMIKDIINEYYQKGYSLIPLKNNSKIPAIRWKKYKYRQAGLEEILGWLITFNQPNIGIVTGDKLVDIDVDDPSKLPELFRLLPEAEKTTRVKTRRGFQFYFSNNNKHRIRSTKNLFNLGIELHAEGRQVVAPPSKIDNFTYRFIIPLSEIKPLPEQIIKEYQIIKKEIILPGTEIKEVGQAPGEEYKQRRALSLPRYNGQDRYCMKQILDRKIPVGERDNSLFILYNLLLQNKNRSDHAKRITILKNNSLAKPLTDQELKKLFRKGYRFKCSTIRETLPYVECSNCRFKFKGGVLGVGNILVKNIRKLSELGSSEQRVLLFLGTVFDGEKPTNYAIAKKTGMNKGTVKEAIRKLKKKGII